MLFLTLFLLNRRILAAVHQLRKNNSINQLDYYWFSIKRLPAQRFFRFTFNKER